MGTIFCFPPTANSTVSSLQLTCTCVHGLLHRTLREAALKSKLYFYQSQVGIMSNWLEPPWGSWVVKFKRAVFNHCETVDTVETCFHLRKCCVVFRNVFTIRYLPSMGLAAQSQTQTRTDIDVSMMNYQCTVCCFVFASPSAHFFYYVLLHTMAIGFVIPFHYLFISCPTHTLKPDGRPYAVSTNTSRLCNSFTSFVSINKNHMFLAMN